MLQGSGGEDRDNSGYLVPIRQHLVARGIAVLRFDLDHERGRAAVPPT